MTPQSVVVTLDPGAALPRFRHTPGQRVTFCLDINNTPCLRSYNLVNQLGDLPQVAVKQVAEGGSSQLFNEQLQAGEMCWRWPRPRAICTTSDWTHKAHHLLSVCRWQWHHAHVLSGAACALKARPDHRVTLIYANSSRRGAS